MRFRDKFSYQGQAFGYGGGKLLYRTRDASLAEMFVFMDESVSSFLRFWKDRGDALW